MTNTIIETNGLTVYYGDQRGILDVDLQVEKGEVFGFLGPNGAGKTTLQRVLMDVIRPTRGHASIFGLDCQKQGHTLRERIGYLPGELSLYDGMKADAFLDLLSALGKYKDHRAFRHELYERLNLDPSRKMKAYSRGNKQKVGIIAALMNKPDLLVLDEPTSGLDPLMQQVVLELVQEAKDEGRTVFFSSHILPEVQAVCDRVAIIREGKLIQTDRVDTLTEQQFKRIRIRFREAPPTETLTFNGVTETARDGRNVTLEIAENMERLMEIAAPFGIEDIDSLPVTLEEIFMSFYGDSPPGDDNA